MITNMCHGFRPLTGMVRTIENGPKKRSRFRPLAGMVHDGYVVGTGNYGFRPLRGWYRTADNTVAEANVFAPLRGSWRAAPERVLRGEVEIWYKDFDGMAKKFLSPYGDGTG